MRTCSGCDAPRAVNLPRNHARWFQGQDIMRYLNVTIIDSTGNATHTQISGHPRDSFQPAIDWMEDKMFQGAHRKHLYVACFIYDTRTKQLLRYDIDGIEARLFRGAR